MSLTVDTKAFREAVEAVAPVAAERSPISLFSHIYLTSESGQVQLSAISSEVYVSRSIAGEGDVSVLLPGSLLLACAKSAGGATVTIEPDDRLGATVRSGSSKARLPGLDPQDFPCPPTFDGETVLIEGDLCGFTSACDRVAGSASSDDHRPILKCVRVERSGGKATAVATNTHILGVVEFEADGDSGVWDIPARLLKMIPTGSAGTLCRLTDGRYAAHGEGWIVAHLAYAGTYPAWERVVPSDPPLRFSVVASDMVAAVRRMTAIAESTNGFHPIIFTPTPEGLKLTLRDSFDGRSAEDIVQAMVCDGPPVCMDASRLMACLKCVGGDEVKFAYEASSRPALLTGDSGRSVILPLHMGAA